MKNTRAGYGTALLMAGVVALLGVSGWYGMILGAVMARGRSMWVWVGPKWMRPGSRFSRAMWLASLPVAAVLVWFGWTQVGAGSTGDGKVFLVLWTVGIVAIEA